jgi:hypothetical protein
MKGVYIHIFSGHLHLILSEGVYTAESYGWISDNGLASA